VAVEGLTDLAHAGHFEPLRGVCEFQLLGKHGHLALERLHVHGEALELLLVVAETVFDKPEFVVVLLFLRVGVHEVSLLALVALKLVVQFVLLIQVD